MDTCSVDGCERSIHNRTNRLCSAHYSRFWKHGDVRAHIPLRHKSTEDTTTCREPDCLEPRKVRGRCERHYRYHLARETHVETVCAFCGQHYFRQRQNLRSNKQPACSPECRTAAQRKYFRERAGNELCNAIETSDYAAILFEIEARSQKDESGCWIWTGKKNNSGYPMLFALDRVFPVHRMSHEAFIGKALGKQPVHHKCGVSLCVNPNHLQTVTHFENAAEMLARNWYISRIRDLEARLVDEVSLGDRFGHTEGSVPDDQVA